jgi:hypothetical protein
MDGLRCPCCRYKLRTKRRNFKFKAELRDQQKAIEEAKKITISSHSYNLSVKKSVIV